MNEYKIERLRDGEIFTLFGNERKIRKFLYENFPGDIQKILRHSVKVEVKLQGTEEFIEFKTSW